MVLSVAHSSSLFVPPRLVHHNLGEVRKGCACDKNRVRAVVGSNNIGQRDGRRRAVPRKYPASHVVQADMKQIHISSEPQRRRKGMWKCTTTTDRMSVLLHARVSKDTERNRERERDKYIETQSHKDTLNPPTLPTRSTAARREGRRPPRRTQEQEAHHNLSGLSRLTTLPHDQMPDSPASL